MLSKVPPPKIKDGPNYDLIGIILILVLIVGIAGGYVLFSQPQTPVITTNTSNNTTANNTTSTVENQPIVKKKETNPNKSNNKPKSTK
ncbi:MAG: hypothetical protein Q7I96_07245 [Methanobacteriaceae archaeon]|jgi:hypothetical protein|nr:hypothetical protein [Methanobacteriaceae archaeon]